MNDGDAIRKAIDADPSDDLARLAHADWLEENGRQEQADFARAALAGRCRPFRGITGPRAGLYGWWDSDEDYMPGREDLPSAVWCLLPAAKDLNQRRHHDPPWRWYRSERDATEALAIATRAWMDAIG